MKYGTSQVGLTPKWKDFDSQEHPRSTWDDDTRHGSGIQRNFPTQVLSFGSEPKGFVIIILVS